MTSIGSGFNISVFERAGITVSNKEISADTIAYFRDKQAEDAKAGKAEALTGFNQQIHNVSQSTGIHLSRAEILEAYKLWSENSEARDAGAKTAFLTQSFAQEG